MKDYVCAVGIYFGVFAVFYLILILNGIGETIYPCIMLLIMFSVFKLVKKGIIKFNY